MARDVEVTLIEKTAVQDKIGVFTRIFLGVTIGSAFIASAASFVLFQPAVKPAPVPIAIISNIQVTNITATTATVSWDTSLATCGRVNYGTVSGQLNSGPAPDSCYQQTTVPAYTTGHQATMTGLLAGTAYYYQIVATNNLVSPQKTFTTTTTPAEPAYTNIRVISVTATSATIGWDTTRTTCSNINYGTVSGQLNTGPANETAPCTGPTHQATISGLTAGTVYYYEIVGGGTIASGQQTFTTAVNTGPYSNIRLISTGSTYVTIGWDTTRTSCSNINYGTVSGQLNTGPANETSPCTGPSHQATISGLQPSTVYFYEIVGLDGVNNVVSGQQTFTTAASSGYYSNVRVLSRTATSATIGWDTTRTSCSNINYGTVSGQLNTGPANETTPCSGPSHQATITGLTAGTMYFYEIIGGGSIVSGQQVFTTSTVVGSYENVRVISKTATSATIGWDTTRTTCSNINYGTVSGQLNTGPANETTPCTGPSHKATLNGLTVGTTYYYQIVGGGAIVSGQQSFRM